MTDPPPLEDQRGALSTALGQGADMPSASQPASPPAPSVAAITLPAGGGAIRTMGEKFATNPVTGTGSMSVPVATSPGRSGFGPQLSLSYDSGAGNGPFGLGWSLSAPAIHRKTDKGLPRYRDGVQADVFVLPGADDLVPIPGPALEPVAWGGQTYTRLRMRPRTEGSYARIELWTNAADLSDSLWRVVSRENITAWYGLDAQSRIADPEDPRRIFEWLLSQTYDDKGNVASYSYKAEDSAGVDPAVPHERNRTPLGRSANRYLKTIRYGNRRTHYPTIDAAARSPLPDEWLFEVVFDYGEHDDRAPTPADTGTWAIRPDPFSSYRAGFEIRTYRRCRRVLMFHNFPEVDAVGANCLVRSTDLTYADEQDPVADHPTGFSFLASVASTGYLRSGAGYTAKSLPPVDLTYSAVRIDEQVRELAPEDRLGLPEGLDGDRYRLVDLDGDGVPGVLSTQAGALFYARNISPARSTVNDGAAVVAFAPAAPTVDQPSLASLSEGQMLTDLDGDGRLELVDLAGAQPGFHARTSDRGWGPFITFDALPNLVWGDPELRFVDLTGDGLPDVLIAGEDVLVWYPSLGAEGFGDPERVAQALDEERGPRVVFSDPGELFALADISGDGLVDLVRIRWADTCYWPNLGYGHFGAKVTMDRSPVLGTPEEFDPRRVLLADIDGSGTTDLIFLGADGVSVYFNRSGNTWSEARPIATLGPITDPATVSAADLLGNGTACLVLSSPLPADRDRPVRYVDLMADGKPHLLTAVANNIGGETRLRYAASTRFAQADELAGRPWITRLPFPVHVVEYSEAIDHVAGTRFVSRYAYHHGAYDGAEREFRGFAMVECQDTDIFDEDALAGAGQDLSLEHHQPPITTYTWFHTGTAAPDGGLGHPLVHEYRNALQILEDCVLPDGLAPEELGECLRALRGVPLHQEIYSFDGTDRQSVPYSVAEHRYNVRRLQERVGKRPAVFATDGLESVTEHLEREPSDPRVAHSVNLELDVYGQAVKTAAITYGRVVEDPTLPAEVREVQSLMSVSYAEVNHTEDIDVEGSRPAYRLRSPYETRAYEITGVTPAAQRFTVEDLRTQIAATAAIGYEVLADGSRQRRLVGHQRTLFRDDALVPMALGQWDTLGLSYESYSLAHTPGTLAAYPPGSVTSAQLNDAGFVDLDADGQWWAPSGTVVFGPAPAEHFYLALGARDPLGLETQQTFDSFDLLVERVSVVQATWNETLASNDYRVLGPLAKTDANGNRSAVVLDELGMVIEQVTMGKQGSSDGDTLEDPTVRLEYDLDSWRLHGTPCMVHILAREEHSDPGTRWQESFVYADGGGGVAMVKQRVAPGAALRVNPDGTTTEVQADPRWLGSGRTVLNNKGSPIRSYDPYFSPTSDYEDEGAIRTIGVGPVLHYDPAGRLVLSEFPEGTTARFEYGAWRQQAFDANDTVLESKWYADRGSPDPQTDPEPVGDPERRAAWLAAAHADTPGTAHFDAHGRAIYAVSDYGGGKTAAVRLQVDYGGRFITQYDQLGRVVTGGFTGLGGRPIYGDSAEKGRRYAFADVCGATLRTWDEHGRVLRAEYDELHRPLSVYAREAGGPEVLFSHVVYGDRHPQAREKNLLGVPHLVFDQAGVIRTPALDFRGNPTRVDRELANVYNAAVDWSTVAAAGTVADVEAAAVAQLEVDAVYSVSATINALGHPTRVTLPDGTVLAPTYDAGGQLASLDVQRGGTGAFMAMLVEQDYDALGRRLLASYGNGLQTHYAFDPLTERLSTVTTMVPGGDAATQALQGLSYTYDPVGNVVAVNDAAQQTFFFQNAVVTPGSQYTHDALYQLVAASGREHAGTPNDAMLTAVDLDVVGQLPDPNDATAVRRYSESYDYDLLGNITALRHRYKTQVGAGAGWTRNYRYAIDDDPSDRTNRLVATSAGSGASSVYGYDVYGNMTQLPNVPALAWNALDQLQHVSLDGGGDAYYVYAAGGQRVRRVVERPGGLRIEEIQLGPYEVRREYLGDGAPRLEHQVIHVADDGGRVAQIETKTIDTAGAEPANAIGDPVVSFHYGNHSGSAALVTNAAGAVISYEEYHPWGTSAYRCAKPGVNLSLKQYRFSGKHRDEETGLYAFGARYYAPWLGRWTSSDPAGTVSGSNLYRYCANDPVGRGDPNGTQDRPLSPHGQVSWMGANTRWVYESNGQRLPDAQAIANFETWVARNDPTHHFTPGSVTVDWSTMNGRRGPTFNAEWLDGNGQPLLPHPGEFGSVAPMRQQPPAEYTDPGTRTGRLTENEHGTPGAQQRATDPTYANRDYRNDPTVRNPRGVALDKTQGDNARSAQIKAQVAAGQSPDINEMDMASRDGFQEANERARAAGEPHIRNPGSIDRGTLEQSGTRFGRNQQLPPGAAIEEPDIRPTANAPTTPPPSPSAAQPTSSPGGGMGFLGGAANTGGNFALAATRTFIPGVAEAETAFAVGSMYAYAGAAATAGTSAGLSAALAATGGALGTAAAYTPVVGGSLVAGAIGGNVAESLAANVTDNRDLQVAAGVIGAAATGAAVGALIGSVVPIAGTVIGAGVGAAVGAIAGLAGYLFSKFW